MHTCTSTHTHTHTHREVHVHAHTHTHTHAEVILGKVCGYSADLSTHIPNSHAHMHKYTHTHTERCMCTRTHTHTHVHAGRQTGRQDAVCLPLHQLAFLQTDASGQHIGLVVQRLALKTRVNMKWRHRLRLNAVPDPE